MDHIALKAWREAAHLTQVAALPVLRLKSRRALANYESGARPVPPEVEALALAHEVGAPAPLAAVPGRGRAKRSAPPAPPEAHPLAVQLARSPLYATTSAEALAMRAALAVQRDVHTGEVELIPLRPNWRRVGLEYVNDAIPDPVAKPPPMAFRPRGVLTLSGAVYDRETAHRMSAGV